MLHYVQHAGSGTAATWCCSSQLSNECLCCCCQISRLLPGVLQGPQELLL